MKKLSLLLSILMLVAVCLYPVPKFIVILLAAEVLLDDIIILIRDDL